jgi:hypothetical protein
VRVTDDEREQVVARLHGAVSEGRLELDEFDERVGLAYAACTAGELARVVHDVPERVTLPPPPRRIRWTLGALGTGRRAGRWLPAARSRAVAVLGNCRLDFEEVTLPSDTTLVAAAFLGGIEVIVPEGMAVELGGFALLGSKTDRGRRGSREATGPLLRVRVRAVLGSVAVRTRQRSP